jgi:hypothetical protein
MSKIPVKGCNCSNSWYKWYKDNHPDFENYFAWTVKAHNFVNAKLKKQTWTVKRAMKHWIDYLDNNA